MVESETKTAAPNRDGLARAVMTDVQFWIPLLVLLFGLALLVWLHG